MIARLLTLLETLFVWTVGPFLILFFSPKARTAINSAMQKVEKTTAASARRLNAATPQTRVFKVRGPSGTVYQFTRAA